MFGGARCHAYKRVPKFPFKGHPICWVLVIGSLTISMTRSSPTPTSVQALDLCLRYKRLKVRPVMPQSSWCRCGWHKSWSLLCDRSLIEAGPWCLWLDWQWASRLGGGDRWHSRGPNYSDTTQGASVADYGAQQRAAASTSLPSTNTSTQSYALSLSSFYVK